MFVLVVGGLGWILETDHSPVVGEELGLFLQYYPSAVFLAGMVWLIYVALEPFLRSNWPGALIGWSRLLAGRFRDPLVGRDILVGAFAGTAILLLGRLERVVGLLLDLPPASPATPSLAMLMGGRHLLDYILEGLLLPLLISGALLFLLLILRVVLRKHWLAVGAMIVLLSFYEIVQNAGNPLFIVSLTLELTAWAGLYLVLSRFGVLSVYFTFIFSFFWSSIPALRFSQWYAGGEIVMLLLMAAIVGYAFHTSLAGRSLFSDSAVPAD